MFNDDQEIDRYYHNQYQTKLDEIEQTFDDLKSTTANVIKQAVDVTDQLKQSVELYEKRFDAIVNNVNDLIIIKTINRQWTIVNDFACDLLNIDREMCLGKSNKEIYEIYPQLTMLLSTIDKSEQHSWLTRTPSQVHITTDIGGKPFEFQIVIKPIETEDSRTHEIVVVGKVVK